MIVREIAQYPAAIMESFDFFNDFNDTHSWLLMTGRGDIAAELDQRHAVWLEERLKDYGRQS